jgi:hypothetical protein
MLEGGNPAGPGRKFEGAQMVAIKPAFGAYCPDVLARLRTPPTAGFIMTTKIRNLSVAFDSLQDGFYFIEKKVRGAEKKGRIWRRTSKTLFSPIDSRNTRRERRNGMRPKIRLRRRARTNDEVRCQTWCASRDVGGNR